MSGNNDPVLQIKDLTVEVDGQLILDSVSLTLQKGELAAIMGPNGSGKSTLAKAVMAHPQYLVKNGKIFFKGQDITDWPIEQRGKSGIFLAFQHPESVSGVPIHQFLRQAMSARRGYEVSALEARLEISEWSELIGFDKSYASRSLNEGFSGGERKKNELLQMAVLEPDLAVLDETDTGLDIDALKIVANSINVIREKKPDMAILLITHYQRLLDYLALNKVYLLVSGKIVETGDETLAKEIDQFGYEKWKLNV
jgi:Fe-S cluster assembly ATP-binding protein